MLQEPRSAMIKVPGRAARVKEATMAKKATRVPVEAKAKANHPESVATIEQPIKVPGRTSAHQLVSCPAFAAPETHTDIDFVILEGSLQELRFTPEFFVGQSPPQGFLRCDFRQFRQDVLSTVIGISADYLELFQSDYASQTVF